MRVVKDYPHCEANTDENGAMRPPFKKRANSLTTTTFKTLAAIEEGCEELTVAHRRQLLQMMCKSKLLYAASTWYGYGCEGFAILRAPYMSTIKTPFFYKNERRGADGG